MIRKICLSTTAVLILAGCGGAGNINDINNTTSKSPSHGISIEEGNGFNQINVKKRSYIPKGEELTQEMAYKFLNMTTFGATPELAEELRTKGVEAWVEEQLSLPYIPEKQSVLRGALEFAKQMSPAFLQGNSIDDIIKNNSKEKSAIYGFNNTEWETYVASSIFNNILRDKSQLRQRVAYALSQTIIASESVDEFFRYHFHALAYYYDFLLEHAFGNYRDILYDVTMTPAMATFLTYHGNRKTYTSKKTGTQIKPDENYGREIMQLFTLGLYKLNMDGTQKSKGKSFLETYTQDDINNMSRVFTGLTYPYYEKFGAARNKSDLIHPMECVEEYHDMEPKKILGTTLPGGQSCKDDIKSAIDILMNHENIAPFISKKLIMRLTKSNPKPAYVKRVAEVFNDNGYGKKGDLGAVVKAILLDEEVWENITKAHGTKIKEPYIAYMGLLRAFDVQPVKKLGFYERVDNSRPAKDYNNTQNKLFIFQAKYRRYHYKSFAQAPLLSPSVFNFYEDSYTPDNNEIRKFNFVAPEAQIQTTPFIVKFGAIVNDTLYRTDKGSSYFIKNKDKYYNFRNRYFPGAFIIDSSWIHDEVFANINSISSKKDTQIKKKIVEMIVDKASWRLFGKYLTKKEKEIYVEAYAKYIPDTKNTKKDDFKIKLSDILIRPILLQLVTSDEYMVQ